MLLEKNLNVKKNAHHFWYDPYIEIYIITTRVSKASEVTNYGE